MSINLPNLINYKKRLYFGTNVLLDQIIYHELSHLSLHMLAFQPEVSIERVFWDKVA